MRRLVFAIRLHRGLTLRGAIELAKCGPVDPETTLGQLRDSRPVIETSGEEQPPPSSSSWRAA